MLVYVSDTLPGFTRHRRGKGFVYRRADGAPVREADELRRIRALAIPPAYRQVWICPIPDGHLQATGRDARGRKQYRYHPDWREAREADKFERLAAFAQALPRIRARVKRDLAQPIGARVARETVLAAIVRLLDATLVRVGNAQYARENGAFGLTTLRNGHAAVRGQQLRLRFKGKSGVQHEVALHDPRVARVVRRCQELPGQELFQYTDDEGQVRSVASEDVNAYLREASGADFTAKDFRTWHGSVVALSLACAATHEGAAARSILAEVARRLRNTVAVCRKAYVHPRVLALLDDSSARAAAAALVPSVRRGLARDERLLLALLACPR